jgi:hypothetical protein
MSYLIEATLAYLDEKSKNKKTKEPRWQDSDGDGKWYEPGDDVKVKKESADADLFDVVMEYLMSEYEGLDEETAAEVMSDLDEDEISYIEELYKGKHGQSDSEYQAGRSDAGKRISGDEKTGPNYYTKGRARGATPDAPTAPGAKPVNTPKLSSSEKEYHQYNKSGAKNRAQYNKVGGSKGLPG